MEDEFRILPEKEAKNIIFNSTIELGIDVSEIGIDKFLDEGIVKEIPVLGSFYKIGKIGYSIERIIYIYISYWCLHKRCKEMTLREVH